MKRYLKLRFVFVFCLALSLIFVHPFAVYADVNDLLISTDSNALMTMELDDSDYSVMPMSALGSVVNTVDLSQLKVGVYVTNGSHGYYIVKTPTIENNKLYLRITESDILDGYHIWLVRIYLKDPGINALPPAGKYKFSFDLSNNFNFEYRNAYIDTAKNYNNAANVDGSADITRYCTFENGEAYCPGVVLDIGSVDSFTLALVINESYDNLRNFDSTMSFRFERTTASSDFSIGSTITSADTNEEISSGLSDLSSSVDTMTDEISGVTEAIQNLQGAMEPHYSNVLTQLHHITEQLHALWDQQFNLHHVPLMAKLDEIKSAIANMDLEVVVELDELKQTVNNMSQAIQNKLQSVQDGINNKLQAITDTITGGYNPGTIDSKNDELSDKVDEFEQSEQDVLDQISKPIDDFEFDNPVTKYLDTFLLFGNFLQDVFTASGAFGDVINLSFLMGIALMVAGLYRFKGGN